MTDHYLPSVGAVLVVSDNVPASQITRSVSAVTIQNVVDQTVVVNRSWSGPTQDQIARLPVVWHNRLFLARTSDPVQELSRRVRGMEMLLVVDAAGTVKPGAVSDAARSMTGPGSETGGIGTRPGWVGGLYQLDLFRTITYGIDLADHRSRLAALTDAGWNTETGLELEERPILDLGVETLRRLPDLLTRKTKPVPRGERNRQYEITQEDQKMRRSIATEEIRSAVGRLAKQARERHGPLQGSMSVTTHEINWAESDPAR